MNWIIWVKEKSPQFWLEDTRKLFEHIAPDSPEERKLVALGAAKSILHAINVTSSSLVYSDSDRRAIAVAVYKAAKGARNQANSAGYPNYSRSKWATAAIAETWLFAYSGRLGEPFFQQINEKIFGWVSSHLSDDDFRTIGFPKDFSYQNLVSIGEWPPQPITSGLSLLYPAAAGIYALTTPMPAIGVAGYTIANLGYLLFAASMLRGTFLIFGLRRRWHVALLAILAIAVGITLSNFW